MSTDETPAEEPASAKAMQELDAMKAVFERLDGMEPAAAHRVLAWVASQFPNAPRGASPLAGVLAPEAAAAPAPRSLPYNGIASLFAAALPNNGPECALVAAYWFQVVMQQEEFDGRSINDELKQMGRPLANVTATLTSLINQRPQLVMQTQKIGKGAQGRKRYKLTQPGIDRVRRMLDGHHLPAADGTATAEDGAE